MVQTTIEASYCGRLTRSGRDVAMTRDQLAGLLHAGWTCRFQRPWGCAIPARQPDPKLMDERFVVLAVLLLLAAIHVIRRRIS